MSLRARGATLLIGLFVSTSVLAHAMLDRSAPPVGSSVKSSPARVELWFTQPLEPAFSSVKVLDGGGRQVDRGDSTVDSVDAAHLLISVPALPSGRYRVVWRAISADTHVTEGDFTFDVAP